MNYYSHHIGDYLSATAHLTLLEHGAYRRLIDVYYIHESPLPADKRQVYRLVGARTKEEKEAIDSVLEEFFEPSPDGWHQGRCEHEIAVCNKNRENGKKGGRPSKNKNPNDNPTHNPNYNPEETQQKPKPNPTEKPPITPSPHHPITESTHASTSSTTPSPAGLASARMRQAGLADANPSHPKLSALLAEGVTLDEFGQAASEAVKKKKGFAYALAVAEGRRRDAETAPLPRGSPSGSKQGLRADYLRQQGYTGGENGNGSGERIIDGQAERVA